jgi:hypothetical protein
LPHPNECRELCLAQEFGHEIPLQQGEAHRHHVGEEFLLLNSFGLADELETTGLRWLLPHSDVVEDQCRGARRRRNGEVVGCILYDPKGGERKRVDRDPDCFW